MGHGLLLALLLVAGCGNSGGDAAPARTLGPAASASAVDETATATTTPSAAKRSRLPRPGVLHGR